MYLIEGNPAPPPCKRGPGVADFDDSDPEGEHEEVPAASGDGDGSNMGGGGGVVEVGEVAQVPGATAAWVDGEAARAPSGGVEHMEAGDQVGLDKEMDDMCNDPTRVGSKNVITMK